MKVAVIGASHKPERYSNMAIKKLLKHNHTVYPLHPAMKMVESLPVYTSLDTIGEQVHTVTLYVNAERSSMMQDEILAAKVQRVIFNPGAENPALKTLLQAQGVETVEGCTLVMLDTNQF